MNNKHGNKFEVGDKVYCVYLIPRKVLVIYELPLIIIDIGWSFQGKDKVFSYLVEEVEIQKRESPWTVKEVNLFTTLAAAQEECKKRKAGNSTHI